MSSTLTTQGMSVNGVAKGTKNPRPMIFSSRTCISVTKDAFLVPFPLWRVTT